MVETESDVSLQNVAQAVAEGFSKTPKQLPSWLFYNETGDKIFQQIMRMPEYYLTGCEYEILETSKAKLLNYFSAGNQPFNLLELGAGDGLKTEILLKHFVSKNVRFTYSPIDVSANALDALTKKLHQSLPELEIEPIQQVYSDALEKVRDSDHRKVFLFLGANIGNFEIPEAIELTRQIADTMHKDELLLIGFDLKKDPRLIQAAYDDSHGITRDFNMNLLVRLNQELGANFQLDQFRHYPFYDPQTGTAKSYLISLRDQYVSFRHTQQSYTFKRWEIIHTEVSQKYDVEMIETMADKSGLEIVETLYDCKYYFCDVLMRKKKI